MMKLKVLFALAVVALLGSCVKMEDIQVKSVDGINMRSLSRVEVGVTVENRSMVNLKVVSAEFDVKRSGKPFAKMVLAERMELPRRQTVSLQIPIRVQMTNIFAAFGALSNLDNIGQDMTVSGTITGRAGWVNKKIEVKEMPLSRFINTFGVDLKQLDL